MNIDILKCHLVKESEIKYEPLLGENDCVNLFRTLNFDKSPEEVVIMFCRDAKGCLSGIHEISHGTIDRSLVDLKSIFKRALLNNASSIIICHNHPSGDVTPSHEDSAVYNLIHEAGELLDIPLLDFLIITQDKHLSLNASNSPTINVN